VGNFNDLDVWRKAHTLTLDVYEVTKRFPREEIFGLTSQLRRASSSIAANLTEGCGRKSDPELRRFVHLARGSASELEYHLLLARDLTFLSDEDFKRMSKACDEVSRMLNSLSTSVKGKNAGYA
jgi:four helix bundle protein